MVSILAINKDVLDETGMFIGTDVWLSDEIHTYYVGMNTGVVGQYGSSTGWYRYFDATYDLYNVAEELFGVTAIEIVSITLT